MFWTHVLLASFIYFISLIYFTFMFQSDTPASHFCYLNVLFQAYNLIIKRITRSAIIVENNTKDVILVKTNISSLYSKRHIQSECLLECKDEVLVFTNITSLVLISTMIALLVILFIIFLIIFLQRL